MQRCDQLLTEHGPPPREVCLEWAWQLRELSLNDLDRPAAWCDWAVDHDGRLQPAAQSRPQFDSSPTSPSSPTTIGDLISQLLVWGGCVDSADRLEDLPSQLDQAIVEHEPTVEQVQHERRGLATAKSRTALKSERLEKRKPKLPVPLAVTATLGVVLLSAGGLCWMLPGTTPKSAKDKSIAEASRADSSRVISSTQRREASDNSPAVADTANVADATNPADVPDLAEGLALSTDGVPPDHPLDAVESMALDAASPLKGLGAVLPNSSALSVHSVDVAGAENSTVDQQANEAANDALNDATTSSAPMPEQLGGPAVDVLSELEKVAANAQRMEHETAVPDTDQEAGNGTQPLQLATFPPSSTLRVPEGRALKVRQPTWMLKLAPGRESQDLIVSPADAQRLSGRDVAQWRIELVDAKRPLTAVYITAQLQNPRSTTIRWQIAAVAEDAPNFQIPIDRSTLDALQQSLNNMNQQLGLSIDQLKSYASAGTLPTAVRSLVSRKRRDMESQLKVGQRFVQVVADANQLAGLLGRPLSVHARLTDAAGNTRPGSNDAVDAATAAAATADSPPLLQFGGFE